MKFATKGDVNRDDFFFHSRVFFLFLGFGKKQIIRPKPDFLHVLFTKQGLSKLKLKWQKSGEPGNSAIVTFFGSR